MFSISKILPNLFMPNSFKVLFGCRCISKIDRTRTTTFLRNHQEISKKIKEKTNKNILKEQIAQIDKNNQIGSFSQLITEYIYLIENDEEIDYVSNHLDEIRKDRNVVDKDILPLLSIRLVNHLLYLNKFQKLIQLTKTKKIFFDKYRIMHTIKHLIDMGRVDDTIRIYETLNNGGKILSYYFIIRGLLLKNTMDSFEKMKEIVSELKKMDVNLSSNDIINIVLLAINQKNYTFAYEFLNSEPAESRDVVFKNLQSIVLSHLNKLDESLSIIEDMQEKNDWIMYDLEKKFFKQTLDTFRTSAQNNNELLQKFDIVFNKIIESKQLNDVDLFELATEYKRLKKTEETNSTKEKQPRANKNSSKNTPNQRNKFNQSLKEKTPIKSQEAIVGPRKINLEQYRIY